MYSFKVKKNPQNKSKYKYSFNSHIYDIEVDKDRSASFDSKIGATRADPKIALTFPEKIKTNNSFSLEKINRKDSDEIKNVFLTSKKKQKSNGQFKLPQIKKNNPEELNSFNSEEIAVKKGKEPESFYQSKIYRSFKSKQNTYLMGLARQHFIQTIQAIRIGKSIKLHPPKKQLKLAKKNPSFKTIFLDLDQCLVHCDESSSNYTVKLNFPIEGGGFISAGVKVRPHCQDFLKQLSSFAEIILFTASAPSYANVVVDYLDPNNAYFSHRLYRNHCTIEKGYFLKDLRIVNRKPENSVLVDNSAFSFMCQPYQGIPILPFYNFSKDKELLSLLQFLKQLVNEDDMRETLKNTFFWEKYIKSNRDARRIFMEEFGEETQKQKQWIS